MRWVENIFLVSAGGAIFAGTCYFLATRWTAWREIRAFEYYLKGYLSQFANENRDPGKVRNDVLALELRMDSLPRCWGTGFARRRFHRDVSEILSILDRRC